MTELLEEENTNLSTSHEHAHLISMYTSLNSLIFVSPSPCPPTPVFGLGLACQAKGHSNRIPTFRPCHVFTEITEKKTEEKCEPQLAKHISALQKKARGNKNIFSVEHDS